VGDVSGKGLAAALYMSQAMALLRFTAQHEGMPFADILPSLDGTLRDLMGPRDFLTLALLEWDDSGRYRVARAGHPPVLRMDGADATQGAEIPCGGKGLGLRPAVPGRWEVVEGRLEPRQWLVMYSDGLTEAMNQKGELYGLARLKAQIQHLWPTGSVRAAAEAVFQDVASFESSNRDDRTLFILGREAP
jgi:sigma-B regulation protein RsbU (phosphoserine phosphatase)